MLKILQARPQQYVNWQLPDVKSGFRKGRGTNYQIANSCWIIEKAREFQKISTSASLTMLQPLTVWIIANCGIFLKRWEYQTTLPASWETCMQDKKQVSTGMEQWTGSKLGKEYVKAVYCHPAYLNYMYSTSYEMLGWMTHRLGSRMLGEISPTPDRQMIPLEWQKVKRASWWRWKRTVKKLV